MIKTIVIASLALAGLSQAATISVVRSGPGTGIIPVTSGGTLLSTGNFYIGVGSYATAPDVGSELIKALADFKEFANSTAPTSGGPAGTITGTFAANGSSATTTPADFNAKELYILVGNGATKALSTEFALLKGTPVWNFVGDVSLGAASATVTLANLESFSAIFGTEVDNAQGSDSVRLVAVPETGSAVLSILATLGLLTRRKR